MQRDSEAPSRRDRQADRRDQAADAREARADAREAAADARAMTADLREVFADAREAAADQREEQQDARDRSQDAREARQDERELEQARADGDTAHLHLLAPREREVLGLIAEGLTNEQIAERLFLSINTLKSIIRGAYRKTGVKSRTQAVLWYEHGDAAATD
ncbi:MAG: helix-turn-helix transcriptional regulator [Nocardioides sp.]